MIGMVIKYGNTNAIIFFLLSFSEKSKTTHKSVTCCNTDDCNGGGRTEISFPIVLTFLALKIVIWNINLEMYLL